MNKENEEILKTVPPEKRSRVRTLLYQIESSSYKKERTGLAEQQEIPLRNTLELLESMFPGKIELSFRIGNMDGFDFVIHIIPIDGYIVIDCKNWRGHYPVTPSMMNRNLYSKKAFVIVENDDKEVPESKIIAKYLFLAGRDLPYSEQKRLREKGFRIVQSYTLFDDKSNLSPANRYALEQLMKSLCTIIRKELGLKDKFVYLLIHYIMTSNLFSMALSPYSSTFSTILEPSVPPDKHSFCSNLHHSLSGYFHSLLNPVRHASFSAGMFIRSNFGRVFDTG